MQDEREAVPVGHRDGPPLYGRMMKSIASGHDRANRMRDGGGVHVLPGAVGIRVMPGAIAGGLAPTAFPMAAAAAAAAPAHMERRVDV